MKWLVISLMMTTRMALANNANLEKIKLSIVQISASYSTAFFGVDTGHFTGTGFIIDSKKQLLITNRHLIQSTSGTFSARFWDGRTSNLRIIYIDPSHDFSIVKYDDDLNYPEIPTTSYRTLSKGDALFLVGFDSTESCSYKEGSVVNLSVNKGDLYSQTIQTNFDRTHGSSGSPILNNKLEVVAIHFRGNDTVSFELPVDYITAKLKELESDSIKRAAPWIKLKKVKLYDAIRFLQMPKTLAQEYIAKNIYEVLVVDKILGRYGIAVNPSDIVYQINNTFIGDDLFLFDQITDQSLGNSILIQLIHFGKIKAVTITLENYKKNTIDHHVTFNGGIFHELTNEIKLIFNIGRGIFLSQADDGTPFSKIGANLDDKKSMKLTIIERINGHSVNNLNEFCNLISKLGNNLAVTIDYYDLLSTNTVTTAFLELVSSSSKINKYETKSGKWKSSNRCGTRRPLGQNLSNS